MCYMERIGVRELRQNASEYLKRARQGETIEVTSRGEPVARLTPVPAGDETVLDQLVAAGKVRPARGKLSDLGPPLAVELDGSVSDAVSELREERLG